MNYKFDWGAPPSANSAVAEKSPATSYAATPALALKAPAVSQAFSWTGIYIGGDGGYGWHAASGTLTNAAGAPSVAYDYDVNGPFAGVFAGGNYQFGRFVGGLEGDWQRGNLTGNSQQQAPLDAAGAFPAGPFTVSTTIKDYESVRGRFGIALDRFLLFGTAGLAWGDPSASHALFGSAAFAGNGGNFSGWTAGAGLEYAISDHVFGRIEYRYTALNAPGLIDTAANFADAANKRPLSDVRVGFAYKFASLDGND